MTGRWFPGDTRMMFRLAWRLDNWAHRIRMQRWFPPARWMCDWIDRELTK